MNCAICHRELSDPVSIERNIGSVCYAKLRREIGRKQQLLPEECVLSAQMGGEIEALIRRTEGRVFDCIGTATGHVEAIGIWYGYPHEGGLPDASGRKWWAYQKCSHSPYVTSWWKVERRIVEREEAVA